MRIQFEKCYGIHWDPKDGWYYAYDHFNSHRSYFQETRCNIIEGVIKEKFKSAHFLTPSSYIVFRFDDVADEAMFLLWSNEGVEL